MLGKIHSYAFNQGATYLEKHSFGKTSTLHPVDVNIFLLKYESVKFSCF